MSDAVEEIRNRREPMQYRRFGRTGRMLSVITLGGMRYERGWEKPRYELPPESIENCRDCVVRAFDAGINHIETAWGYGKSEHLYGKVLNEILDVPRRSYHLMTKGRATTAEDTRTVVERQLQSLQTDYIDLYGWHGINTEECLKAATAPGGPVEELRKMVDEGIIGHVGFSTHGPPDIVQRAIGTDLFDFVNLHYYYFYQAHGPSIRMARERDMGVFIISPNDKGGRLFRPSDKLRQLTAPLTPIQWNARFCLRTEDVHTLSFGMTAPDHFEEMRGVFPVSSPMAPQDERILERMDAQLDTIPHGRYDGWELAGDPSGILVPEVLRLRRLLLGYDMKHFGQYRYNMFGTTGHWYPGRKCDEGALAEMDESRFPEGIDVKALLRETHAALNHEGDPETGH